MYLQMHCMDGVRICMISKITFMMTNYGNIMVTHISCKKYMYKDSRGCLNPSIKLCVYGSTISTQPSRIVHLSIMTQFFVESNTQMPKNPPFHSNNGSSVMIMIPSPLSSHNIIIVVISSVDTIISSISNIVKFRQQIPSGHNATC